MSDRAFLAPDLSRHAFRHLATLWFGIVFLTFLVAVLLFSTGKGNADPLLLLPKPSLQTPTPVIVRFSQNPSSDLVKNRCLALLKAVRLGDENQSASFRNRRVAESDNQQAVGAIRAYRECSSRVALDASSVWQ